MSLLEFEEICIEMATLLGKLSELPKECPEIVNSKTFKEIHERVCALDQYLKDIENRFDPDRLHQDNCE